jgi:hypothetical protein
LRGQGCTRSGERKAPRGAWPVPSSPSCQRVAHSNTPRAAASPDFTRSRMRSRALCGAPHNERYVESMVMRSPRREVAVHRNFLDDLTRHNSACLEAVLSMATHGG